MIPTMNLILLAAAMMVHETDGQRKEGGILPRPKPRLDDEIETSLCCPSASGVICPPKLSEHSRKSGRRFLQLTLRRSRHRAWLPSPKRRLRETRNAWQCGIHATF